MQFTVEQQCPQCGAPAEIEETDRIFECGFCRVKSYLVGKGAFRYVLPSGNDEREDMLYLPYWRYRGMLFSCIGMEIKQRVVDHSYQAVNAPCFPGSLGLRSQALKLRYLSPDIQKKGRFFKPMVPLGLAKDAFEGRFSGKSSGGRIHHQALIGETVSLIYAPYYLDDAVYDGVLGKRINPLESASCLEELPEDRSGWRIGFVPTLCPNCGWDLHGERDTLVLNCKNCDTAWTPESDSLKQLPVVHIPSKIKDPIYLPFWRFQADVSGLLLNTYADFVKVANLPKAIQKGWNEIPFYFWTLAFKISPQVFLRLCTSMTIAQPDDEQERKVPRARVYPVTLPKSEAVETLKLMLAGMMTPKRTLMPRLSKMDVAPRKYRLVYVPFEEGPHDLYHPDFPIAVNKNMLKLAEKSL